MTDGLPEPAPGYRWEIQSPPAQKRRRNPWPWVVSLGVIAALAVGAWFAGEWLARDIVERTIRTAVVDALDMPADQQIDVELPGAVLPQLLRGQIDEISVGAADVQYESFSGDVRVHAAGVPISGEGRLVQASGTITMDIDDLRRLLSGVEGFPVDTLSLAEPDVTMSTELTVLGTTFPIGIGLTPAAADGDITLTPALLRVGDAEVSADELRQRFGRLAESVLGTWTVCIAGDVPAGLTLGELRVQGEVVVADVVIDRDILVDPTLQEPGTCA